MPKIPKGPKFCVSHLVHIWRLWGILSSQPQLPLRDGQHDLWVHFAGHKDEKRAPQHSGVVDLAVPTLQHPRGEGSGGTATGAAAPEQTQIFLTAVELWDGASLRGIHQHPHSHSELVAIAPATFGNVLCSSTGSRNCKSQHYQGCSQLLPMTALRNICSAFCPHRVALGAGQPQHIPTNRISHFQAGILPLISLWVTAAAPAAP